MSENLAQALHRWCKEQKKMRIWVIWIFVLVLIGCQGDPVKNRDNYFASGNQYIEEGKLEEGIIQYRNALKSDGSYIPARMAMIEALRQNGNHDMAIAELRRVLEQDENHIEAKLMLGNYYLMAAGSMGQQWFEEAQNLANDVLEVDPQNVQARILLGNSFAGLNDFSRSIEELERVLQTDPQNLAAYLNMGAFEMGRREPEKALEAFQTAVKNHPDSPEAHRALGNYYAALNDYSNAETSFRRAFELASENKANILALIRLYLLQNERDKAEEVLVDAIEENPDEIELKLDLANFHISQGDVEKGLNELEDLRSEYPENRMTAIRLAEIYLGLSNFEDSAEIVEELLEKSPADAEAHYLKGRILVGQNEFELALSELDQAITLKPSLVAAYLAKADLQLKRLRFEEAEETLRQILSMDKNNFAARGGLAKVLALTRKTTEALVEAERVLDQVPSNIDALTARAEANLRLKKYNESKADFSSLLDLQPQNAFFLHRLGTIEAMEGNLNGALDYFRSALKINPDLTDVINDIIVTYFQQNNKPGALAELDRLIESSEKKEIYHLFRGRIQVANENYDEAEQEFRKAIELAPNYYQAYMMLGQLNVLRGDLFQAIEEVDNLIRQDDKFAPAYLLKAFYLDESKKPDDAVYFYRKTLELDGENHIAANNLAWLLAKNQDTLVEARTLAERAREQDPKNTHYADTLGWIYYRLGLYTLAVDQLLFAVNQSNPATAENYYRLGMALFKKGDLLQAKSALRTAITTEDNFEGAEEARATLKEIG
jgi:tetratricopeptide (TPR) repeat protein